MKKMVLFFMIGLLFFSAAHVFATPEEFKESRKYEHVVVRGSKFEKFYLDKVSVEDLMFCAYDPVEKKMKVIPFQIDERVTEPDPFSPSKKRASYFLTNDSTSGILDMEDELVFMLKDLGPKAPVHMWIDDELAQDTVRYEVAVFNKDDQDKKDNALYGYLFYSPTLKSKFTVPSPYDFLYDAENDVVSCVNYFVRFGKESGMIEDIKIYPPLGNGLDIFDVLKIRVVGVLGLGIATISPGKNGEEAFNERDNFFIYPFEGTVDEGAYLGVTKKPIVRLIREVRQSLKVGNLVLADYDFFVETKFYPFSGFNAQGANLNPDSLKKQFPGSDSPLIEIDLVRQSWDYNENAKGMKFYNRHNKNVLIDGVPDNNINKTLSNSTWEALMPTTGTGSGGEDSTWYEWKQVQGISEWNMASGDQGTVFSHLKIIDTSHEKLELYYHDNENGGQDDNSFIKSGDTGDEKSYGDQGLKILNTKNLDINFAAYFVDGNKDQAFGELMARNFEVGSQHSALKQKYDITSVKKINDTVPKNLSLKQNYPNPFNNSTRIEFELPHNSQIELNIIDLNGRMVKSLINDKRDAGAHSVTWNGKNDFGEDVPTGVYIYQIQSDDITAAKKLLLVK